LLWCISASAGTVAVEAPTVESNRYVFPIAIGADASGAASLDFQLRYDPEVFTPVSVGLGPAAMAAGKVVEGNADAPGSYRVLVMGLNQNSLPPGQVAQVVFERNADATATSSQVSLEAPTLADASGAVLPSNGSQQEVVFDRAVAPSEDAPADKPSDAEEDMPPAEAPASPATPVDKPATGDSVTPLPGNVAQQVADVMLSRLSDASRSEREAANGNQPVSNGSPARVTKEVTMVASQDGQMNSAPPVAQPGTATPSDNEIQIKQSSPAEAAPPGTPEVAASGQTDSTSSAAQTVETKANVTILAAGGDGGALQGGRDASPAVWLILLGLAAAGVVLVAVWWWRRFSR
jgi:hypothetical protein